MPSALCNTLTGLLRTLCPPPPTPPATRYVATSLVSDGSVPAPFTDPNLINGWGVAFNPNGFVWVSAADSGKSTLYDGTGKPQTLVVTIPSAGSEEHGSPTGIVYNGSGDFTVKKGNTTGPARFIFATEDGTISGWAPNVDGTNAILAVDNSATGASYKGLAIGGNGNGNYLFATDFKNAKVDVFDATFKPVVRRITMFEDPTLPAGYAPFGIQNIQGDIYVTFGKINDEGDEEEVGPGLGYVSVFNTNGNFIRRVASQGTLNAPWGLALSPAAFGTYSNSLLVGNFGDGRVSAFNPRTGEFLGQLRTTSGPLSVDGLWGMAFGNGIQNQPTNSLFFAAGPNDEEGGLYGSITVVQV